MRREVLVKYSRVNPMVKQGRRVTWLFVGVTRRGARRLGPRRVSSEVYGVSGPGRVCRAWQSLGRDACLTVNV